MTDYKQIADIMQENPVENKTFKKAEFNQEMKKRRFSFIQKIDSVNGFTREVWGNKTYQIIVSHNDEQFKIL